MRPAGALLVLALALAPAAGVTQPVGISHCVARVERSPGDPAAYYCFVQVAQRTGAFEEAVVALESLRRRYPGQPRSWLALGLIRQMQGRADAEELLRRAARASSAENDAWGVVYARAALARVLITQGRFEDGEVAVRGAETAAGSDPVMQAHALCARGALEFARDRYIAAQRAYERARALLPPGDHGYLDSWILSGLGAAAWARGDDRSALEAYAAEARILRARGNRFEEAARLWNVALVSAAMARRHEISQEELRERLDRALEAAVASRNRAVEADCHLALGQLAEGQVAVRELELALELSADFDTRQFARRQLALALHRLGPERWDEALALAEAALGEARRRKSAFHVARAAFVRAVLLRESGSREQAIAAGVEALDAVEAIRGRQPPGLARARVLGTWTTPFSSLADWVLATAAAAGDADRSLDVALQSLERMRARVLLDTLRGAGAREPGPGPPVPRVAEIQAALEPGEMLLAFQLWERDPKEIPRRDPSGGSWVLAFTRETARAVPLPNRHRLEQQIDLFRGLFARRDGSEREVASRLYDELLGAVLPADAGGVERLVIVPDGPLRGLPFAALRTAPEAPPLIERIAITSVPSATLWLDWHRHPSPAVEAAALALADPELPPGDTSAAGAPSPWRGAYWYGSLPFARLEGRSVVRRLGAGLVRHGRLASESFLREAALARFPVIDLAAHAVVDTVHPRRSAVLLASGGEGDDGLLSFAEIVDLDLSGQLVILSGCRSAGGAEVPGEGALGLAHAFFRAGARAVLGTEWPVRDREVAAVIDRFASALAQGRSAGQALAIAQRWAHRRGMPADAWAGLELIGDGDFHVTPHPGHTHRVAVALLAAGALLLVAWWRWRAGRGAGR
ncbi:MAG: hypothetical protein Kow0062_19370 [Acidobacteriota bacterium]